VYWFEHSAPILTSGTGSSVAARRLFACRRILVERPPFPPARLAEFGAGEINLMGGDTLRS
jgi:hypothetical protein